MVDCKGNYFLQKIAVILNRIRVGSNYCPELSIKFYYVYSSIQDMMLLQLVKIDYEQNSGQDRKL